MTGNFNLDHLRKSHPDRIEHELRLGSVDQLVSLVLEMLDKIKKLETEIDSLKVSSYDVTLEYESGANTTEISKFLQQELHINAHEAANLLRRKIIISGVSKEEGTKLQEKLKNLHIKTNLVKIPFGGCL